MRRRRVHLVRQLAELLEAHGLTEISAVGRRERFTLRREEIAAPSLAPVAAVSRPTSTTAITAPLAGTFYGAPPGTGAPFVRVGDEVMPGRCVGLIVAGDTAHEIVSTIAGRAARILPVDGEHVDAGQALVELEAAS
jgi:acetyl-CoA carboxylase biotin carboxyl carrier protein